MAKPNLYMYNLKYKVNIILSRPLVYSWKVFKLANFNPMERKIDFRENWLIFLGIWGEAELILRILGAKEKYFEGTDELSFRDLGRSMHYFQGSWEYRTPGGLTESTGNKTKRISPNKRCFAGGPIVAHFNTLTASKQKKKILFYLSVWK